MSTPIDTAPVPAHITNVPELAAAVTGRHHRRRRMKTVFRTFALTAANPLLPVLAEDLSRRICYVQAQGNSVLLCESQSQAQDPDNAAALAFANPQGTLLYVNPATVTSGLAVSLRWPVEHNDVMWAVAIAFPAFLAMTITNEAGGVLMAVAQPGASREQPVYMKLIMDTDGKIDWRKIAVMLAITALSGYIATQSQRGTAGPDFNRQLKMRVALAVQKTAHLQAAAWQRIEGFAKTAYEIQKL